jgi:hypothetical protein
MDRLHKFLAALTEKVMPKYVIERELPDAGKLSAEQLRGISQKSRAVLQKLGPQIQWIQSYVTDEKIYCIYLAPNGAMNTAACRRRLSC